MSLEMAKKSRDEQAFALSAYFETLVDPTIYNGEWQDDCLVGQTGRNLATRQGEPACLYPKQFLQSEFPALFTEIEEIYVGVIDLDDVHDYSMALEFAREVLFGDK